MVEFLRMTAQEFRESIKKETKWQKAGKMSGNKYHAKKTTVGDTTYDSKKEATRGQYLEMLQKQGVISDLQKQKEFVLIEAFEHHGIKYRKCSWIADFYYYDTRDKKWHAEDVKSFITRKKPEYRIKVKLFVKKYPHIWFNEVV